VNWPRAMASGASALSAARAGIASAWARNCTRASSRAPPGPARLPMRGPSPGPLAGGRLDGADHRTPRRLRPKRRRQLAGGRIQIVLPARLRLGPGQPSASIANLLPLVAAHGQLARGRLAHLCGPRHRRRIRGAGALPRRSPGAGIAIAAARVAGDLAGGSQNPRAKSRRRRSHAVSLTPVPGRVNNK
jgi:hypothetical protein